MRDRRQARTCPAVVLLEGAEFIGALQLITPLGSLRGRKEMSMITASGLASASACRARACRQRGQRVRISGGSGLR